MIANSFAILWSLSSFPSTKGTEKITETRRPAFGSKTLSVRPVKKKYILFLVLISPFWSILTFNYISSRQLKISMVSCVPRGQTRLDLKKNYLLPQPKCNLFKGSLSYSGVVVWDSIPTDIKNSKSLDIFIKKCTDWIKG